jgi:hypothetical protein
MLFDVAVAAALVSALVAALVAALAAIVWLRVIIFVCSYYIRKKVLNQFFFSARSNYYIFMQSNNYI